MIGRIVVATDVVDFVATGVVLVADVKRLMDVAQPVTEEEKRLSALPVRAGRVRGRLRMLTDAAQYSVVRAIGGFDGLRVPRHVEEVPLLELAEVLPLLRNVRSLGVRARGISEHAPLALASTDHVRASACRWRSNISVIVFASTSFNFNASLRHSPRSFEVQNARCTYSFARAAEPVLHRLLSR